MHELIKDLIERIKAGSKISRNPEEDIATLEEWLKLEDDGDLWSQINDSQDKAISLWLMRKKHRDSIEKDIGKAEFDLNYLRQKRGFFGPYTFIGLNIFDVIFGMCGLFMGPQKDVKSYMEVWVSNLRLLEGTEELCAEIEGYSDYITYEKVFEWYKKVAPFAKKRAEFLIEEDEKALARHETPELLELHGLHAVALEFLK